jgi:hypothetical protein
MEVCRCVEFTGVELTGGAEVAAPVEKAVIGPVEKAVTFRSGGKDGPRVEEGRSGQEAPWRARKTSSHARARWRCWPAADVRTL